MANLSGRYRVEVSTTTADGSRTYGQGRYGDDDWGSGVVWTDLACNVLAVALEAGRTDGLTRPDVGRCTVRVEDWTPTGAPFAGRPFRLLVQLAGGEWAPAFTGTVEDATATITRDNPNVPAAADWTITATDVLGALQRIDPDEGELVRPAEPVRDRIAAVCAFAGVAHTFYAAPAFGDIRVQADDIANPLLEVLGLAADSAGLIVYASAGGAVLVDEEEPTRPSQYPHWWVVGPNGWGAPSGKGSRLPCALSAAVANRVGDIRNRITVANAGQSATVAADETSIGSYRRRDYRRTDLIASTGGQAATLANVWLQRYSRPTLRLYTVELNLEDHPDPLEVAARLEVAHVASVWLTPNSYANGRILGYRWELTASTAELTLNMETPIVEVPA